MHGLVIKGIGGFYTVVDERGQAYTLRAQSKIRRQNMKPCVGDRVVFTPGQADQHGWLESILPRRNELLRPSVANIDLIVMVAAPASPEPDLMMIDRMLMLAKQADIPAMLVINKEDLDGDEARLIAAQYEKAGLLDIRTVCAMRGEGVSELRERLSGCVHAFGGQSGVGKSTLINALYGLNLMTGSLSEKIERGKHTTRHVELIPVDNGGMVLDTPGFSLVEVNRMEPVALKDLYPEFLPYENLCRYTPCLHISEPDCAVKQAVERSEINGRRYERYLLHIEEMRTRWRDRYD